MPALFVCSPHRHRGTEKSGGGILASADEMHRSSRVRKKALRMTRVESRCGDRDPSSSLGFA
jgi:hypothetical protein